MEENRQANWQIPAVVIASLCLIVCVLIVNFGLARRQEAQIKADAVRLEQTLKAQSQQQAAELGAAASRQAADLASKGYLIPDTSKDGSQTPEGDAAE